MADPTTARLIPSRHPPYLQPATRSAAAAYHQHHFNCPACIAAGKSDGDCCAIGAPLHQAYLDAFAVDRSKQ